MLPNKFKIVGLLIALASLITIISRITYLMNRPPITVTIKGEPPKASQVKDSIMADKYYKTVVQTVDSSGKVIKSISRTTSMVHDIKDPITDGFNLACIMGLLICVLSKEKIEDERIDKIRLIAFRTSFIIGVAIGMFFLALNHYKISMGAEGLIMCMLAGYFIVFLYLKQREASY